VLGQVLSDATEEQAGQPTGPAGADHQQVGVLLGGEIDQRGPGVLIRDDGEG
jgi:hypothetical protein